MSKKKREFKRKTDRRELSDVEKGMIIAFFVAFGIVKVVADLVRRPWTTVKGFLKRYYIRGLDTQNRARSGRYVFAWVSAVKKANSGLETRGAE